MGKVTPDFILDAPLDLIASETERMIACSAEPTTYTEATATFALADAAMAPADFTKANGDVSGRKTTVAAKTGQAIDANGTANHIALVDDTGTRIVAVTTCPSQGLSSGGTVDFGSFDIEFRDPT